MLRFGLPRTARVRKRGAFVEIQRDGRKTGGSDLVMLVLAQRKPGPSRVGVTASRRVGGAVVRNRLKRYVREVFRQHRAWFPDGSDVVFVARPSAATLDYAAVRAQIEVMCARHAGRSTRPAR
jgi:ribonuclease P protein component